MGTPDRLSGSVSIDGGRNVSGTLGDDPANEGQSAALLGWVQAFLQEAVIAMTGQQPYQLVVPKVATIDRGILQRRQPTLGRCIVACAYRNGEASKPVQERVHMARPRS